MSTPTDQAPEDKDSGLFFLRVLLGGLAFYTVYQNYFPIEFTIPGLNIYNSLFLGVLFIVMYKGIHSKESPPAKGVFTFLFVMLTWGYLVGVLDDDSTAMADLVELKTSLFYILMYYLYYRAVQDMKTLKIVLAVVLFTAFLAQLQAVRQGLDYGLGDFNETRRAAGPFGTAARANSCAAYFVIMVPVATAMLLELKRGWKIRALLMFSVGIGVFGLFVTYSRQGYFILGLILLYLTFRKNLGLALMLCLFLASYQAWAPDAMIQRIEMTKQDEDAKPNKNGEAPKYDESTESRFLIWDGAYQMMGDRPLGVGLNHFKRNIGKYVPRYAGYDAHNNYIRMAAEATPIASAAMIFIIIRLFILGIQVERVDRSDSSRAMGLALQAAMVGVLMSNFY
ncbi:MAG TPA: O-antigen ligase family protein, partial [Burkholderiaceae bacterium]|nr:O-antigen ligase family protein [Burkholderiaceae bacterium]